MVIGLFVKDLTEFEDKQTEFREKFEDLYYDEGYMFPDFTKEEKENSKVWNRVLKILSDLTEAGILTVVSFNYRNADGGHEQDYAIVLPKYKDVDTKTIIHRDLYFAIPVLVLTDVLSQQCKVNNEITRNYINVIDAIYKIYEDDFVNIDKVKAALNAINILTFLPYKSFIKVNKLSKE